MQNEDAVEPLSAYTRPGLLSRSLTITWESAVLIALTAAALFSRLWMLGARVMSHDESLHVYYSWLLATGKGFAHNPMMHGPFLFEATALIDLLFGASDFTSRLAPALLGTALVIAVPRLLRPWLGRAGSLAATILLSISPFILYFSRYIRHDILVIAWVLAAIILIFRHLERPSYINLMGLAAALALMLSTMEISFIYLAILAGFLLVAGIGKHRLSWKSWRGSPEFELLIIVITLGGFFSSPIALVILNPIWNRLTGTPFVDLSVLNTQGFGWATGVPGIRLWALLGIFGAMSTGAGLWWDWKRWPKAAGIFFAITIPLFTTLFSNPAGFGTGFIGSLGYWLSQQGVARGSQPWYYYLIVFPLYEYLPLLGGVLATVTFFVSHKMIPAIQRRFVEFLLWWAAVIFLALSVAGEKMPWLSTHIAIPFILLTGWWLGRLVERIFSPEDKGFSWRLLAHSLVLSAAVILAVATIRTSIAASYINYDYTTEFIDYAHGAPGVKWALSDIAAIANHTGAGQDLKIAYDDEVSWPMSWFLRDYRNQAFYGDQPNRSALDAAVVLSGPKHWNKVDAILGNRYHRFELIRLWWPMEDYKNLTWERIRNAVSDPSMRSALWDIFWNRDYHPYAELTGEALNPPANWPLAERMRVYVRKDIAAQMLSMDLGPTILPDIAEPVDAYASLQRSLQPLQVVTAGTLNAPRGLAIAPDRSLYVADTGNSRIVHMDAAGKVLNTWGSRTLEGQLPPAPGTFVEPWGVAVDPQGNVYVADTWNHRVQKFDPSGEFLLQWGSSGQPSDGPDGLWGPRGIAVSPEGRIYLTDTGNKRVLVFDTEGKFQLQFDGTGDGKLDEPVGIALGPNGLVYVADTWNSRVAVFTADGKFMSSWPVQGWAGDSLDNKPYLTVDAQGRVYITDPEKYRVVVFSPSGTPLGAFGQYGPEPESFGLPVGIAADKEGTVWLVDAGNNRLENYGAWK